MENIYTQYLLKNFEMQILLTHKVHIVYEFSVSLNWHLVHV